MLVDPMGNRVKAGKSPKPGQGRVEFLVEVCDPSEADEYSYAVNGVVVSDFYTPDYFAPASSTGARYSFTGAITKPRQVLKGGDPSWHDPVTDHWFQQLWFGGASPRSAISAFSRRRMEASERRSTHRRSKLSKFAFRKARLR